VDTRKSISVIIPTYNGRHLLQAYLPLTYAAIKNTGGNYEVIIVDDCSEDGSAGFIRAEYPEAVLIVNDENKGFSHAYNRGIEAARFELILLLSADVKLSIDYFEHQWKYFLAWDTFGVIGRIVDLEGDHIQEAARVPKLMGLKIKTDYCYYTHDSSNRLFTFYLPGVNALIDAEKLKQIGGFYELFSPFFCADIELSLRAWRLKWKCHYEHSAVCHRDTVTVAKNAGQAELVKNVYYRNWLYLHAIHLNGWALAGWYFQITITDVLPNLFADKTGIWESYKNLLSNRAAIKDYKERVKILLDKNDTHITVFNVVTKIRNSVKNKKVTRFKAGHD